MTVANDFLTQTARNSQNFAVHFVSAHPDGVGATLCRPARRGRRNNWLRGGNWSHAKAQRGAKVFGCAVIGGHADFTEYTEIAVSAHPDGVGADLVSARRDATANRCHSGLFILGDGHAYFMIGTQIVDRKAHV